MNKAYIGLGTNLGDRVQNLLDAREQLMELPFVESARCSSLYVSSPVGDVNQPNFINCALELCISGEIDAHRLLLEMQAIENKMGRIRDVSNRNAARVIDLDLLVFGDEQLNYLDLIVPHPRLAHRLFVLQPLLELDAQLHIPGLGDAAELLSNGIRHKVFAQQILHKLG